MSNRSKSRTKNTSLIHNEVKLIHHSKKKVSRLSLLNDLLLSSEFFRQYSKRKAKTPHKNNTTRNKKLPISITSKECNILPCISPTEPILNQRSSKRSKSCKILDMFFPPIHMLFVNPVTAFNAYVNAFPLLIFDKQS